MLSARVVASQELELDYLPLKTGFITVGGLRVVVVEDRLADGEASEEGDEAGKAEHGENARVRPLDSVRVLKEWDVVGELWVKGSLLSTSPSRESTDDLVDVDISSS